MSRSHPRPEKQRSAEATRNPAEASETELQEQRAEDERATRNKRRPRSAPQNEGEGNRRSDRYRRAIKRFLKDSRADAAAESAARVVEGPEDDELRHAEQPKQPGDHK